MDFIPDFSLTANFQTYNQNNLDFEEKNFLHVQLPNSLWHQTNQNLARPLGFKDRHENGSDAPSEEDEDEDNSEEEDDQSLPEDEDAEDADQREDIDELSGDQPMLMSDDQIMEVHGVAGVQFVNGISSLSAAA